MIGFGQRVNVSNEDAVREYLDHFAEGIEGIWEFSGKEGSYRLAIIKKKYLFEATILEKTIGYSVGDRKATLEYAASDEILTIKWIKPSKSVEKTIGKIQNNNASISFNISNRASYLYRVYPKLDNNNDQKKRVKNEEWAGNGSGIIISESGYIITNHH